MRPEVGILRHPPGAISRPQNGPLRAMIGQLWACSALVSPLEPLRMPSSSGSLQRNLLRPSFSTTRGFPCATRLLSHLTQQQHLLAQVCCLYLRAKITPSKRCLGLEPLQAKDRAIFHAAEANVSVLRSSAHHPGTITATTHRPWFYCAAMLHSWVFGRLNISAEFPLLSSPTDAPTPPPTTTPTLPLHF